MGKVTKTKVIEEGSLYKFYFIRFQYLYMNLREKGGSNLLFQRRNRREQSRFRPSRSCPLLSPPDRIRGKIQRIHRQSQGGGKLSLPSRHPPSIPFIHGSARASGNCLSQSIYSLKYVGFWPASGGSARRCSRRAPRGRSRLGMAAASPLSVPGHDAFLDLHGVDLRFCQYCSGL